MKWLAFDSQGRPVARLLAESYIDAMLFVGRGGVPGAHDIIGDNAHGDGDIKATEARLIASFREGGLSEAAARVAARGRYDSTTRILRTIRVPPQSATAGSSSTAARISEREAAHDRQHRSLDLREPTAADREFDGLAELVERGTITEGGQELGATPPIAWAQLLNFKASDGTETFQWRVPVCPLCTQRHLIPDPAAAMDDPNALLGEQAMPCGKGLAVLTDAATTSSPPDEMGLHAIAKTETARGGDGLAEAEARLYDSFREGGLSEAEARIAARGRDRR